MKTNVKQDVKKIPGDVMQLNIIAILLIGPEALDVIYENVLMK